MRDLVRHLGEIQLWAAANIGSPKPEWLHVGQLTDLQQFWPDLAAEWPEDDDLIAWDRATHANLVHVLRTAPLFAADILDELITRFAPRYRIDAVADRRVPGVVAVDTRDQ